MIERNKPTHIGSAGRAASVSSRNWLALGLITLSFAFVYGRSLAFVYVEGDDATLVAHHAMGRIPDLQPVYSPYESMFDAVLDLLPADERVVRVTAMALTAISAPWLFFLMMLLAFEWVPELRRTDRLLFVATMLLAIPELFYLSMVLTPSIVAMALLVSAHLLVRRSARDGTRPSWSGFVGSAALFGVGAACRWDTVLYGLTITADVLLLAGDPGREGWSRARKRLGIAIGWGALAVTVWLLVLRLNGWTPSEVIRVISVNGPVESFDWRLGAARAQTFFTPASVLLIGIGAWLLLKHKDPLAAIVAVAVLAVAKFLPYGVPKWVITMMPTMLACAAVGFAFLLQRRRERWAVVALALLPWVIGVRLSYAGSAWGPGFELQPYDQVPQRTGFPSLTIAAGAATPTPEGPRPLFGHGWVLLDRWRPFVNEWAQEQVAAVGAAIEAGVPLVLPDDRSWPVDTYLSLGFSTHDPFERKVGDGRIFERRWTSRQDAESRMYVLVKPEYLFDAGMVGRLQSMAGERVVVIGFSSTLSRLHHVAPEALYPLGKRTAFLRLDELCARLDAGGCSD